jgi:hypothetical protein
VADVAVAQEQTTSSGTKALLVAVAVGAAVAVALGAYANAHEPAGQALFTLWFSGTINMKAWFTTAAMVLVLVQVARPVDVQKQAGRHLGSPIHRLVGLAAFLLVLPVAYHCLWSLGLESDPDRTRRFVHSILGCAFFGAFTVKVLAVRSAVMPSWALPVVGGVVFATLTGLWATSSLWFFQNVGFPSF